MELMTELDIREVDFELVRGIELDSELAFAALRRFKEKAVYVVCRDAELDDLCVDLLKAVFSGVVAEYRLVDLTLRRESLEMDAAMLAMRCVDRDVRGSLVKAATEELTVAEVSTPPPSVEPVASASEISGSSPFMFTEDLEPLVADPGGRRRKAMTAFAIAAVLLAIGSGWSSSGGEEDLGEVISLAEVALSSPSSSSSTQLREEEGSELSKALAELVEEERLIAKAVNTQQIRALDMLLVDPERAKRGGLELARTHCAQLERSGLLFWRLPTLAEATTVLAADLVAKDSFWTETQAEAAGDKQFVYDGRRKRIKSLSPNYRGARALCVRDRRGLSAVDSGRGSGGVVHPTG